MSRPRGVLYSTACKYALQAAIYLARHPEGATVPQIASDCNLMPYSLANVLRTLAARGILSSSKGIRGGFRLRQNPLRLRLADVVAAIDGAHREILCPTPAPPTPNWRELRDSIHAFLTETTIAQLALSAERMQAARALGAPR